MYCKNIGHSKGVAGYCAHTRVMRRFTVLYWDFSLNVVLIRVEYFFLTRRIGRD